MEGNRGSECLLKPVSNIDFNPELLSKSINESDYFLVDDCQNTYSLFFMKLFDSNVMIQTPGNTKNSEHAFIDIFPYDEVSQKRVRRSIQKFKFSFWNIAVINRAENINHSNFLKTITINFQKVLTSSLSLKQLKSKRLVTALGHSKGIHFWGNLSTQYGLDHELLKNSFETEKFITVPFENISLKIPQSYDTILSRQYGTNYKDYPPIQDQVVKHVIDISFVTNLTTNE